MTKSEKKQLIKSICDRYRDKMIQMVNEDKVPENWDGFELRHWLNKIAEFENIWSDKIRRKPWRKRIKDCENTMIINNLY